MGLYNFQAQFVPYILNGEKQHTIRATRAHVDKPGNTMHLYTGLRQKGARLLARVPCVKVEEIRIDQPAFCAPEIWINSERLNADEAEALAVRDGFSCFESMMAFWRGRLPFVGNIYHWSWEARERS